ncbi:MAG: Fic family protein [Methanomassiliicoccaceae archaeon]|jgi:Fic family protein|nr:Fic family protein [Methanomassiliicoccaceae archaeon]
MDDFRFTKNASGEVKISEEGYCYFVPNTIPPKLDLSEKLMRRFLESTVGLAKLDGKLSGIRDAERFILIDAFARKEAVSSSRIEGIETDVADTYKADREPENDPFKASDLQEVKNYKEALELGLREIAGGKDITMDLVLRMHTILMRGVRGADMMPGMIRNIPVKVGGKWDSMEDAFFVPPLETYLESLLENLFTYIGNGSGNPLLDAALAHYQFEAIHPFLDGNGRIGRLLIMLMLRKSGLMEHPVLYLSEYFNRRRKMYSVILFNVSSKGEFDSWFGYFLNAIDSQIAGAAKTIERLSEYRARLYMISEGNEKLRLLCDMLFENPYVRVKDVTGRLGITDPTAQKLIDVLLKREVLAEEPGKRKGKLYKAEALLDILSDTGDAADPLFQPL